MALDLETPLKGSSQVPRRPKMSSSPYDPNKTKTWDQASTTQQILTGQPITMTDRQSHVLIGMCSVLKTCSAILPSPRQLYCIAEAVGFVADHDPILEKALAESLLLHIETCVTPVEVLDLSIEDSGGKVIWNGERLAPNYTGSREDLVAEYLALRRESAGAQGRTRAESTTAVVAVEPSISSGTSSLEEEAFLSDVDDLDREIEREEGILAGVERRIREVEEEMRDKVTVLAAEVADIEETLASLQLN